MSLLIGTALDAVHSTYQSFSSTSLYHDHSLFFLAFLEIVTQSVLPVFENVSVYMDRG